MKNIIQLNNNLIGQLQGINRMIDEGKECLAVLVQMKAVRSGLNSVMDKYIMEHMNACLEKGVNKSDAVMVKKLLAELSKR